MTDIREHPTYWQARDKITAARERKIAKLAETNAELLAALHAVFATERRKAKENRADWFEQVCATIAKAELQS